MSLEMLAPAPAKSPRRTRPERCAPRPIVNNDTRCTLRLSAAPMLTWQCLPTTTSTQSMRVPPSLTAANDPSDVVGCHVVVDRQRHDSRADVLRDWQIGEPYHLKVRRVCALEAECRGLGIGLESHTCTGELDVIMVENLSAACEAAFKPGDLVRADGDVDLWQRRVHPAPRRPPRPRAPGCRWGRRRRADRVLCARLECGRIPALWARNSSTVRG